MNFWQQLKKPFLVLSPMEDVTDYVFREIVATRLPNPDVFFTEFTSAAALFSPGREATLSKLRFSANQHPIVAQIWGTSPQAMHDAAVLIADLGFDGIDINMGCPDKAVVKHGAGAGLIVNEPLAAELIAAVRKGAPALPLSVKTRLGLDRDISEQWLAFLLHQHLDALTLHARIAVQMSKGSAEWDKIGRAVELRDRARVPTVIIGNGDIKSVTQAREKHTAHAVDGIMIARGIFQDPWIFAPNHGPHTTDEYMALLRAHLQLYTETYGSSRNYEAMKKFFKMYVKDFEGANQLRQQLMETRTADQALRLLP